MERGSRIVKRPRLDLHLGEGGGRRGRRRACPSQLTFCSPFAKPANHLDSIPIPEPGGFKQMQIHFLSLLRHDMAIAYAMSSPLQKHPISSQSARQAFH